MLSGAQAFQLHDTYGFPIDLTLEMAAEQGLSVDEDGFRRLMDEQRARAKKDAAEKKTGNADISVYASLLEQAGKVTFTGYDLTAGEATVVGLLSGGVPVTAAAQGDEVAVVLDRTPFYAEGGGQLADQGVIRTDGPSGPAEIEVTDVQTPLPGLIVHRGVVRFGEVTVGSPAHAEIDDRTAPGDLPLAHRHPPGAPRAARRARRVGGTGRARRTRLAGCGSTSPRRARCRCRCCARWRTRSTGS